MPEFYWVMRDAGGAEIASSERFSSKEDAEAWMGQSWSSLLDEGAESVVLMSDGSHIYEMGLREA